MHTTDPITSTASGPATLGDVVAEIGPLVGAVYVAGPPVLMAWVGTVLFALMLAGPFVLIVTLIVALGVAAAGVTLAGAILATPYLLIRHIHLRLAERRRFSDGPAPIAAVVARTGRAIKQPGIAVLGESMTARAAR
jgi:hypothetical protein